MATTSTSQLNGQKVYRNLPAEKRLDKHGNARKLPKVGRVHAVVFDPSGTRAVGVQVKQPDIAAMIKRPDVFVALDALEPLASGGFVITDDKAGCDKAAIKRLGLDWDRCVIWVGMDVYTEGGQRLGWVNDIDLTFPEGQVGAICVTEGDASHALVGDRRFGAGMLVGLKHERMVVKDEAAGVEFQGGLAARAGEATAQAQAKAAELGAKASEQAKAAAQVAGEAVDKGSHGLGKAIGKAKVVVGEKAAEVRAAAQEAKVAQDDGEAAERSPLDAQGAAKAVGSQLTKAGGMFAEFKKAFDENSQ